MTQTLSSFIGPIKKRWVYNFVVSPKTNIISKPEWYLGQTLKWIEEYADEAEKKVKLTASQRERYKSFTVKQVFILSMIELVIMRLKKDMKSVVISLPILVHTYNEVIRFVKTIHQYFDDKYFQLEEEYDILSAFSEETLFEKLVDVEWENAEKNLKEITSAEDNWNLVLEGDFEDPYGIPRCVDRFIMLIESISERVVCFRQLDCQFKLIELQCYLLNKFLLFLKRSLNPAPARINRLFFSEQPVIDQERVLNGINFLRLLLIDQFHIPAQIRENLDPGLVEKSKKITQDYKSLWSVH